MSIPEDIETPGESATVASGPPNQPADTPDGVTQGAGEVPKAPETTTTGSPTSPAKTADKESATRGFKAWRKRIPRPIPPLIKLGILALIIEYLIVPQIAGTRNALHLLGQVNLNWIILGVALEFMAWVSYAQLTRAVLPRRADPGLLTMVRIQLTTLSVSHCVPGGTAGGTALGYRLLTAAGVDGASVGFTMATASLGSALVLNAIFWVAVIVSIPIWGFSAAYGIAALSGAILMALIAVLLVILTRGERTMGMVFDRVAPHIPFTSPERLRQLFSLLGQRVSELRSDPKMLLKATLWAAANWVLDAASLYVFVGAFGNWVNPDGLIVAFGLANIVAVLPITPGGLGVVETLLSSTLVGFGATRGVAILGVIGYRTINFWLPIPLGGLAYLSLQVNPGAAGAEARRLHKERRREAWRRFFDAISKPHDENV